ncbi:MAG: hypothetical protein FJZ00_06675, partial [Candidatus Sericytochromatia bacterium]|nr:hypothetical protein [Candidatus Tanganyikabacteria bacterium]
MTAIGTIHGMLRRLASLRSQALLPASATVLLLALATVLLLAAAGCALLASPPRLTGPGPVPGDSHGAAVATGVSARLDEGQAESLPQGALASGKGQVAITVVWPVRPPGYRGQFIPDSTTRVLFDVVTGSNGFVASQSVNRPPTATSSIASFELDAGTYKLNVYAQLGAAASPSATATASSGFEVVAGARKSLGLTLSPVFPPALSGLSAGSGLAGDALTLNGTNLGLSWVATPTVKFSGNGGASVSATVSAMTPTSLTVTVPAEFVTGPIDVTVDGLKVTSGTFVAGSLRFWAIRPAPASASDTITLEGEFGGSATVNFPGNVTAPATILGPNRAKVVVPAGATAGSLTVTGGGNTTTALPFRAPSYSLGLGSLFQTGYPQADGALQSTTIQTARHQFGSAVIGKYLYILGGDNGNLNSVERATIDAAGNLSDFSTVIGVTLVTARAVFGTAVIGNYLYVFGGNAGGSHLNSVERAPIDGSGSLGAFSTVNGVTLVTGRQTFGSAVIGSYLYIFGGSSGGDFLASVERAPIDAAGNLGAFAVVNGVTLTTGRSEPGVEIIGNSVYLLGGNNGVNLASVERATIDGSGNLGNFAVVGGVTLASARRTFQSARLGNYLYILGGVGASVLTSVERALIDGSGNLGTFSSVAGVNLAVPRGYFGSAIIGNSLYAFGGYNDSGLLTSVERAGLNASGTLGSFTSGSLSLAVARANQAVAVAGNSLFVLGGSAERDL